MDEILTFEETNKYLKFSKSKLYNLVQQKNIPALKYFTLAKIALK